MAAENTSTSLSEILERKTRSARQQAYDEELARLEKEVEFRSKELLTQWLAREGEERRQELSKAETERANQERSLKNREQEFLRQIEEEERRKTEDYNRRKEDEERRRKDEEERRIRDEADQLAAKKRQEEIGHLTPRQIEQLNKARKILGTVESLLADKKFEDALVEVSKALSLVPTLPEAIDLRERIRQGIREAKEAGELEEAKEQAASIPVERMPIRKKKSNAGVYVVIALVIVAVAAVFMFNRRRHTGPEKLSVVVMPWSVAAGGEKYQYLAYALPGRVAASMHTVSAITVVGYASASSMSLHSKSPEKDIALFGFTDILMGSMNDDGDKLNVKLRLVDSSGTEQWSQTFESPNGALDNFELEVAKQVLNALGAAPDARSKVILDKKETSNATALTLYLQGAEALQHGWPEDIQTAMSLFRQSSDQDPNYIEPVLASASILLSDIEHTGDHDGSLAQAEQLVQKALYINASSTAALIARARIRTIKQEYSASMKELDDALQLEPELSDAYLQKARVYTELGKYDDAMSALKEGQRTDPWNPRILTWLGHVEQLNGQVRQSIADHELSMHLRTDTAAYLTGPIADCVLFDPDFSAMYIDRLTTAFRGRMEKNPEDFEAAYRLGRLDQVNGITEEWLPILKDLGARLKKSLEGHPENEALLDAELALTLTRLGNYDEAEKFALRAADKNQADPLIFYKTAQMYAIQMFSLKRDQIDSTKRRLALDALQKAVSMDFRIDEVVSGDFFNFRHDADFKKLIQVPFK